MKGDAQPLIKFFDGSDKRFIIPLYQRNYDWKEENCEQLFYDLIKLYESNRKSHFFGSIVSCIQSDTEDRFIIDGQQRITTVSLLLIAMVNAFKKGQIHAEDTKLAEKIYKRYLVDEYQEDERKVKLKPIKKDMQAFDALLYMYKTKNTYNFIKLDTRTGQMEMVQWSTGNNTMAYPLSDTKLVYSAEDEIPGRFTLYATTNIYNFVLLDQIDGRTWQVQWHTDIEKRFVTRIY